jgi:predicted permease
MENTSVTNGSNKDGARRPLGVWILTIWDGLFAGVFPAAGAILLYLNNEAQATLGITVITMLLSVLLGLAIVVAAVGAWGGNNRARIALVALVTVHYGFLVFNNMSLASSGVFPGTVQSKAWARALRSLIWIGINLWYFLGERPRAYYSQP